MEDSCAQNGYVATLSIPDTNKFPYLTAYLDVLDPTGAFTHGLTAHDVTLLENGIQVPAREIIEQKPGVQFTIAITPGASFNIRDTNGISRYETLLQGILAGKWVSQPGGGDDFSLLTVGGPQLTHSSNPAALQYALKAYTPNNSNASPSLEVLASALQVAADPTNRPGMGRAILFITPPQDTNISPGLQSIIASANQQNIHIFVWLVASQDFFNKPEIDQLKNLADQTHAAFFAFSHDEPMPDLDTLLEPLRYVYQLGYDSQIATAEPHQISAQVTIGTERVTTNPQSIEINLQPPVPALLNPPTEIVRSFPSQATPETPSIARDLFPTQIILSIQVTYPDGYERSLRSTDLYIDGTVVAENTNAPFDRVVWDLRPYIQEGTHTLSIEVTDSLGLVGKTGETKVKIIVPSTTQGVFIAVSQKRPLLIGATVFVLISIFLLLLILGGRIHPKPLPGQVGHAAEFYNKARQVVGHSRFSKGDEQIAKPIIVAGATPVQAKSSSKSWRALFWWLKRKKEPIDAMAYLIPLVGFDEATLPAPLEITVGDISLGSDPHQANLVISDPSINGLHAWIHHDGTSFIITDAGSVAGTWLNYEQVSIQGMPLEHADIIHLGSIGFRFVLSNPGELRKLVVTSAELKQ